MKRARKAPDVPLTELRLADLRRNPDDLAGHRLVNLKVPAEVLFRVHHVARKLGVTKTAAMIALLNEGLHAAHRRGLGPSVSTAKADQGRLASGLANRSALRRVIGMPRRG